MRVRAYQGAREVWAQPECRRTTPSDGMGVTAWSQSARSQSLSPASRPVSPLLCPCLSITTPVSLCLSLSLSFPPSLCISVSLPLSVSLCLSLFLFLPLSTCVCPFSLSLSSFSVSPFLLSLCLSLPVSESLCVSLPVSASLFLCLSISVSLCLSFSVSLSLSLSPLCLSLYLPVASLSLLLSCFVSLPLPQSLSVSSCVLRGRCVQGSRPIGRNSPDAAGCVRSLNRRLGGFRSDHHLPCASTRACQQVYLSQDRTRRLPVIVMH